MSADRVHLRRLSKRDSALLVKASRDPEIVRWTLIPADLDKEAAASLVERWLTRSAEGLVRQYLIVSGARRGVGLVSIALQDPDDAGRGDVAYWLLPEERQRGLVTRALRAVVSWAFRTTLFGRIALYTRVGNSPSERVAERCGFRFEGTLERAIRGQTFTLRRWILTDDVKPA